MTGGRQLPSLTSSTIKHQPLGIALPQQEVYMKKKPDRILVSSLLMTILCAAALALVATLPGGGWYDAFRTM
jgi:hypothetical protein